MAYVHVSMGKMKILVSGMNLDLLKEVLKGPNFVPSTRLLLW